MQRKAQRRKKRVFGGEERPEGKISPFKLLCTYSEGSSYQFDSELGILGGNDCCRGPRSQQGIEGLAQDVIGNSRVHHVERDQAD
jgi:hypothetical protein